MEGLRLRKQNAAALRRLCSLLEDASAEDLIGILNSLYDKREDGVFLAEVLADTKQRKASLYYERCSGRPLFSDIERFLFAGKPAEAAKKIIGGHRKRG